MRHATIIATVLLTLSGIAAAQADVVELSITPSRDEGGVTVLKTKTIVTATVSSSLALASAGVYIQPAGGGGAIIIPMFLDAHGNGSWTLGLEDGLGGLSFRVTPFAFDRDGELVIGGTHKVQIRSSDATPRTR